MLELSKRGGAESQGAAQVVQEARFLFIHWPIGVTHDQRGLVRQAAGIVGRFHLALAAALAPRDDLAVYLSPADVVLGPNTLVQPDLFVVCKDPGQRLRSWREIGVPVLAIEILSPTTASRPVR